MIARCVDRKIILLTFYTIFHKLNACSKKGDMKDRFGLTWVPILDEQTLLRCSCCDTNHIFTDEPDRESSVVFILSLAHASSVDFFIYF